ncbi:hypothetical protein DERF_001702 [Dermatophagoides farinae]|uniref:Uncharacterized protein n=1 Tax=Dermatophagoides farinae TaxID=6954 RepID=A0A922LD28_DERFA|nr:hypothetical protein DERF_001702 [Dermatophagoides farinae]
MTSPILLDAIGLPSGSVNTLCSDRTLMRLDSSTVPCVGELQFNTQELESMLVNSDELGLRTADLAILLLG